MRASVFARAVALIAAIVAAALALAAPSSAAAAPAPVPPTITPPASANGAICYYGACYNYVYGRQTVDASGASVLMYQAKPELDATDVNAHSLQELAIESADGQQIVEVGWTVDRGLNGDAEPHLFTYHWVAGQTSCYNGCGFVSTFRYLKPGQRLQAGTIGEFGIANRGGNWWISYDGIPIGYYPGSLWGGTFTRFGLVQAFGEVASTAVPTCNDMGDGRFGSKPNSSWIAGFHLTGTSTRPQLSVYATTPDEYDSGFVTATSFHLGGPGDGRC